MSCHGLYGEILSQELSILTRFVLHLLIFHKKNATRLGHFNVYMNGQ